LFALRFLGFIIKAALAIGFIITLIVSGLFEAAFFRAMAIPVMGLLALVSGIIVWISETSRSNAEQGDGDDFMRKFWWWIFVPSAGLTLALWFSL